MSKISQQTVKNVNLYHNSPLQGTELIKTKNLHLTAAVPEVMECFDAKITNISSSGNWRCSVLFAQLLINCAFLTMLYKLSHATVVEVHFSIPQSSIHGPVILITIS